MMFPRNTPASPTTLDENLDVMNFGDGSNVVKQIDAGLHPDGKQFIELMVKSRVSAQAQPYLDHILARAIQTGKLEVPVVVGKRLNMAEALALAHSVTQVSIRGESRHEFVRVLSGVAGIARGGMRFFGSRRQTQYGGPMP